MAGKDKIMATSYGVTYGSIKGADIDPAMETILKSMAKFQDSLINQSLEQNNQANNDSAPSASQRPRLGQ